MGHRKNVLRELNKIPRHEFEVRLIGVRPFGCCGCYHYLLDSSQKVTGRSITQDSCSFHLRPSK